MPRCMLQPFIVDAVRQAVREHVPVLAVFSVRNRFLDWFGFRLRRVRDNVKKKPLQEHTVRACFFLEPAKRIELFTC